MRISMRRVLLGTLVGVCLTGTGPAIAQVVEPNPLEQSVPDPPTGAFGMEGWVKVRYSVLADGTTANVRAVGQMPPGLDEKQTVASVEEWKFSPATSDGVAIDWHNNESVVSFDNESVPFEPSPRFTEQYRAVEESIAEQDFEGANKDSRRMLNAAVTRLREIGLAQAQAAIVNISLEDFHAAYMAIVDATDPRVPTLAPEELRVALEYRFVLEVQLGRVVEALETFARINEIEPVPDGEAIADQAKAIGEALDDGEAAIAVKAKVDGEPWGHALSRRTFAIADVEGSIRGLDVECNRQTTELEFQSDVEWSLPESWGACAVFVDAKRDTTFSLYEFN